MTSGTEQLAPPRRQVPWSGLLLVVLVALALATTYGVVRLRAEAALDCRDMDAGLGFSLNVLMVVLAAANVIGVFLSWVVGRRSGTAGALVTLVLVAALLIHTSLGFFILAPLPDVPLPGCPVGEPPWWPSWLPA